MPVKKINKRAKAKKTKKEIIQTDGKNWEEDVSPKKVKNPRRLSDILGYTENKYETQSVASYEEEIKNMNLIDLQRECARVGLMPLQNREVMVARLVEQFNVHLGCQRAKNTMPVQLKSNKNVHDILSRGANSLI